MQSYLKRLMILSEKVDDNIRVAKSDVKEYKRWTRTAEILRKVIEYSLNKATTEEFRNKINIYWEHNCSIIETLEDDRIESNYENFRKSISQLSQKLYRDLGDMVLYYIEKGMVTDAYVEFLVRTDRLVLEDVIPVGITEMLPQPKFNPLIDVRDCVKELEFLKSVTYMSIKEQISNLDEAKLSLIIAVLKGQSDLTASQKQKIMWGYLFGKQDLKDMINSLIMRGLISQPD